MLLWRWDQLAVSRETVRRWLHRADLVWRRPRPVIRRPDPLRQAKLRALRRLLAGLPADEMAVFEDEVDVNLNPKIGSMWMRRGQQAEVETPGDNAKRYLAGSKSWRTGRLLVTEEARRDGELFVRHLEGWRHRLRRYRVIHVICDNARFHQEAQCIGGQRLKSSSQGYVPVARKPCPRYSVGHSGSPSPHAVPGSSISAPDTDAAVKKGVLRGKPSRS